MRKGNLKPRAPKALTYDNWVADLEACEAWQRYAFIFDTLREKNEFNLMVFGRYFFPHIIQGMDEPPEAHMDLLRELSRREDGAIIFPRGFAKSSWVKIDTLHDIVYKLEDVIIYVSTTVGDAGLHFEAMRAELENNELLRAVYGDLVPGGKSHLSRKCTNRHMETTNGVNIVARGRSKGRGVNIKNRRPTKIIVDDAEDDEQVANPKQRLKFHNWLYNVIFPSLDKRRGFVKMIGTVLHQMAEVLAFYNAKGGIYRRAIENGQSIWPGYWSIEALNRMRDGYTRPDGTRVKGLGTRAFNREYMNNPTPDGEAVIKPDWIEKALYADLSLEFAYECVIYCDPQAGEKATADEYAITALYTAKGTVHRYVYEQQAGRVTQLEQAKNIVRMWLRHKKLTRAVGVEKVMNQTAVWQTLVDWKSGRINFNKPEDTKETPGYIPELDRNIPIIDCQPRGRDGGLLKDKLMRLQMFEADFERGEIHLRSGMDELKEQLMFLGTDNVDHDDRADSLVGALELAFNKGMSTGQALPRAEEARYTNTSIAGNLMKRRF